MMARTAGPTPSNSSPSTTLPSRTGRRHGTMPRLSGGNKPVRALYHGPLCISPLGPWSSAVTDDDGIGLSSLLDSLDCSCFSSKGAPCLPGSTVRTAGATRSRNLLHSMALSRTGRRLGSMPRRQDNSEHGGCAPRAFLFSFCVPMHKKTSRTVESARPLCIFETTLPTRRRALPAVPRRHASPSTRASSLQTPLDTPPAAPPPAAPPVSLGSRAAPVARWFRFFVAQEEQQPWAAAVGRRSERYFRSQLPVAIIVEPGVGVVQSTLGVTRRNQRRSKGSRFACSRQCSGQRLAAMRYGGGAPGCGGSFRLFFCNTSSAQFRTRAPAAQSAGPCSTRVHSGARPSHGLASRRAHLRHKDLPHRSVTGNPDCGPRPPRSSPLRRL